MTKLILALSLLLTGILAAHDVLANSGSPFAGYYRSKSQGCILRVHFTTNFSGQEITTRSESNIDSVPPCNTSLMDFTERSSCRTNKADDLVCIRNNSSRKLGEIVLKAGGRSMSRASDIDFPGDFVKVGPAPSRREGRQ